MSAKFTPGPWAYSTSDEGWTFSIYQADDAGFTPESSDVATLFAHTVQCDPKDIQEANARLIAAAPELLEVVQAMARAVSEELIVNASDEDSCGVLLDFARAALAKAAGETK